MFWGCVFNAVLFAGLTQLPARFMSYTVIVALIYSFFAGRIAEELHGSKESIVGSQYFQVQPSWRLLPLAIISWLLWIAACTPLYVGLDAIGAFRQL